MTLPRQSRTLPEGDYAYIIDRDYTCPALVIRRGWIWSQVLRFRPYDGTKPMRVRTRDLLGVEAVNRIIKFREDPMALLHMNGEPDA
jgi:hypothetical protein